MFKAVLSACVPGHCVYAEPGKAEEDVRPYGTGATVVSLCVS